MSDFPNTPDFPMVGLPDHHWCHQFTIPLLFDDCLSMLQKFCVMWAKLNEVITHFNKWNTEFQTWAEYVEANLTDLKAKYTALEKRVATNETNISSIQSQLTSIQGDLTSIRSQLVTINSTLSSLTNRISTLEQWRDTVDASINSINTNISKLQADLTALTARVKKLEDLLANLNIIPPIKVINLNGAAHDTEWSALWDKWWVWFNARCAFTEALPSSRFTRCDNLYWQDTTTAPGRELTVGQLGQPVVLSKLPFVAVVKSLWASKPSIADVARVTPVLHGTRMPDNPFFECPLTTPFPYTIDEIKFQTGVIPFLPDYSFLYKIISPSAGVTPTVCNTQSIECCVRIQMTKNANTCKMAIVPSFMTVAVVPHVIGQQEGAYDFYLYCVAENG